MKYKVKYEDENGAYAEYQEWQEVEAKAPADAIWAAITKDYFAMRMMRDGGKIKAFAWILDGSNHCIEYILSPEGVK